MVSHGVYLLIPTAGITASDFTFRLCCVWNATSRRGGFGGTSPAQPWLLLELSLVAMLPAGWLHSSLKLHSHTYEE